LRELYTINRSHARHPTATAGRGLPRRELPGAPHHAARLGGTDPPLCNPRLYTPKDFDDSPYFDIIKHPFIGEGDVADYRKLPWNQEPPAR
jgi:hypothetical protein